MADGKKGYFSTLYAIKDEAVAAMKQPIRQRSLNRGIKSIIDSAIDKKADLQVKIDEARLKLVNDANLKTEGETLLNNIGKWSMDIDQLDKQIVVFQNEYKEAFGEEYKSEEA